MPLPRRLLLTGLAASGTAKAQEEPRRAARWDDLRRALFGERPMQEAGDAIMLDAPSRALDAAMVPIALSLAHELAAQARSIKLIIDENPSPLAVVFRAGSAGDLQALSTRVRVDAYTFIHVVAETTDGRLMHRARFVKAAGGCSAPVGSDLRAARERLGRMRITMPQGAPTHGQVVPVQVAVSHPNTSGLQIDQLTRLSIPAEFVRSVAVTYQDQAVLSMECDISIAENPTFGFGLSGEPGGELRVMAEDNRGRRFTGAWTVAG